MFKIEILPIFKDEFKKLRKKYPSIKDDLGNLIKILKKDGPTGDFLGNNCYKIRLKNSDNNKGKSGGYRVITFSFKKNIIVLLSIYSKSKIGTISEEKINYLIKNYKPEEN